MSDRLREAYLKKEEKRIEAVANIEALLEEWNNMSPEQRQDEMRKLSTPSANAMKRIEWLRNWRIESWAKAMTR